MKEVILNSKPALFTFLLIAGLGLASCSNQPIEEEDTTPPPTTTTGQDTQPPAQDTTPATTPDYSGYVVQLIASERVQRADEIKVQFEQEGYNVFVNPLEQGGKTLYRVQIGPYGTELDAKRVLNNMKIRYPVNGLVKGAIIKQNQ